VSSWAILVPLGIIEQTAIHLLEAAFCFCDSAVKFSLGLPVSVTENGA
jgi:hypothetical protein